VIPFLDTKPFSPERPTLPWDQTTSWLTPTEHLFRVGHYGFPEVDASKCSLSIGGLVGHPRSFTLDDRAGRRHDVAKWKFLHCRFLQIILTASNSDVRYYGKAHLSMSDLLACGLQGYCIERFALQGIIQFEDALDQRQSRGATPLAG